jgi:hypothetical protein
MPSWTIPGPTRYEMILAGGANAVPAYFRTTEREREDLHALAAQMVLVDASMSHWHRMTFIEHAEGVWLEQHGRDRGISKQAGESDAAYRLRLRVLEEAVTPASILAIANAVLAAAGVAGSARMFELPRDALYLGVSTAEIRGCFNRGLRLMRTGAPLIIVILPAGTPAAVVAAVSDAIRIRKAAGVFHTVEPS